jgi:hypothetical protein
MNDAQNAQSVSERVGAAAALIRHVWKHKEGEGALHGGTQHACRGASHAIMRSVMGERMPAEECDGGEDYEVETISKNLQLTSASAPFTSPLAAGISQATTAV